MLARTPDQTTVQFTRRDAGRLVLASVLLVAAMSIILGLDVIPAQTSLEPGEPAPFNVYAIRTDRKEGRTKRTAYSLFYRTLRLISEVDMSVDAGDFSLIMRLYWPDETVLKGAWAPPDIKKVS